MSSKEKRVPALNRNVQRGQATRDHLIAVATRLFADLGYEGTSIEAVLHDLE
jgi:AcrR family transcriptional regulator